jgi:hypothetical protein
MRAFVALLVACLLALLAPSSSASNRQQVLDALRGLPCYYEDRDKPDEKAAQLKGVAFAIHRASGGDAQIAALLIVIAFHESTLSIRIHQGLCKQNECDHGKAASLWQLHESARIPLEEWKALAGEDPATTLKAAIATAQLLQALRHSCGRDPAFILTAYAGRRCSATDWKGLEPRLATLRRVEGKLK